MIDESSVNSQIIDANTQLNTTLLGHSSAEAQAILDTVLAETLGMEMHNAVTAQHNSQMVGGAAVAAACARMLRGVEVVPILDAENGPEMPLSPLVPPPGGGETGDAEKNADADSALERLLALVRRDAGGGAQGPTAGGSSAEPSGAPDPGPDFDD